MRIDVGFWQHRKTLRLRARIGDAALWLPPRIWSYAAQNQPDGDFSQYSAEEIAMLVGYLGDAQGMLEALQQASFFDGMKVHGWAEHNGYHTVFAERAKKAATARWEKDKKRKEKTREESTREETSNASSINTHSKAKGKAEEISEYCAEIGLPSSDGIACFDKWQGNGWKNNGEPIKDWKATIRAWKANGYMPSQKPTQGRNGNGRHSHSIAPKHEDTVGLDGKLL